MISSSHFTCIFQVTHVEGFGSISSKNEVTVSRRDGGSEVISTKNILIATGSVPMLFPGLEVRQEILTCIILELTLP